MRFRGNRARDPAARFGLAAFAAFAGPSDLLTLRAAAHSMADARKGQKARAVI
jgi:hypothetical protein